MGKHPPVVVINGLGAPAFAARAYGRLFRSRGFKVFSVSPPWLGYGDLRVAARRVEETVLRASQETGVDRVRLVGMSLGGLIGLYYVKCMGGARHVEQFISVGGPLNGSRLAGFASKLPLLRHVPVFHQLRTHSDLHDELVRAPLPPNVRIISFGTRGDVITPRSLWAAEGTELVETPHGVFPLGHWALFLAPGNLRAVREIVTG